MDISAYKYLNTVGTSLVSYLNGGNTGAYGGTAQSVLGALSAKYQGTTDAGGANAAAGDIVQLSSEAQALLKTTSGDDASKSKLSGIQKSAQNFLLSFFDESGVDLKKLSGQALTLIQGLQKVIAVDNPTGRDAATDRLEMRNAKGTRRVYTLTGNNSRLRLAIEYAADKKTPVKLTMTDIAGGKVETATISISKDREGALSLDVERDKKEYRNGTKVSENTLAPISAKLYKSS